MLGKGGKGRDVVSMTDREKARRMAPIKTVESYWLGLCGEDQIPLRSQVDPRGMENALENAFLMEKIAPSMAKVRVAGTHVSDLMGMQIAGMPLSSIIAPSDREAFGRAVEQLFAEPSVIRIELRAESGFGKPDMTGHMVLMPLRSDFGDVSRALGALVTHGRIGRTPRRFNITHVEVTPALKEAQPTALAPMPKTTTPEPSLPRTPVKPGFAETPRPFAPQAEGEKEEAEVRHGHLRLVVSND